INDLNQVPVPVMLLPDDFKANTKIKVNNHLFNKENLPGHFKFKEYCPQVFRNLRERFGIEDLDYQVSLTRSPPLRSGDDQGEGLLLNSYDRALVIKQISSEDVADMHSILSEYHQHIVKCHGSTLLPQFLGMYRVSVDSEETYLIVMRNMFSHRLVVHRKYDLKGSLVAREASDKKLVKELPTFKDMDFRNNMQKVYVTEEQKEKFMEKLNRDVEFLVKLKIMDYSLLLGIHDVGRAEREEEEARRSPARRQEAKAAGSGRPQWGRVTPEGIARLHEPLRGEVCAMGLVSVLTPVRHQESSTSKTVKHRVRIVANTNVPALALFDADLRRDLSKFGKTAVHHLSLMLNPKLLIPAGGWKEVILASAENRQERHEASGGTYPPLHLQCRHHHDECTIQLDARLHAHRPLPPLPVHLHGGLLESSAGRGVNWAPSATQPASCSHVISVSLSDLMVIVILPFFFMMEVTMDTSSFFLAFAALGATTSLARPCVPATVPCGGRRWCSAAASGCSPFFLALMESVRGSLEWGQARLLQHCQACFTGDSSPCFLTLPALPVPGPLYVIITCNVLIAFRPGWTQRQACRAWGVWLVPCNTPWC
ncbi:phosphatidylinositol 5-phosphate 4-kinase type-2 gamma, partial [Lates japonicus]